MSDKMWYLDRFVDKVEKAFGWHSPEHLRACEVHAYWREREGENWTIDADKLKTELVGYEIEIKRIKGERVGMGVAGHLGVKRVPVEHKVIGRGEVVEKKDDKHQQAAQDAAALWHKMLRLPSDMDWDRVKRKNQFSRF